MIFKLFRLSALILLTSTSAAPLFAQIPDSINREEGEVLSDFQRLQLSIRALNEQVIENRLLLIEIKNALIEIHGEEVFPAQTQEQSTESSGFPDDELVDSNQEVHSSLNHFINEKIQPGSLYTILTGTKMYAAAASGPPELPMPFNETTAQYEVASQNYTVRVSQFFDSRDRIGPVPVIILVENSDAPGGYASLKTVFVRRSDLK